MKLERTAVQPMVCEAISVEFSHPQFLRNRFVQDFKLAAKIEERSAQAARDAAVDGKLHRLVFEMAPDASRSRRRQRCRGQSGQDK